MTVRFLVCRVLDKCELMTVGCLVHRVLDV